MVRSGEAGGAELNSGVRGKLHKINRREKDLRSLPLGEQRLGGEGRVQKGHSVLFPLSDCG